MAVCQGLAGAGVCPTPLQHRLTPQTLGGNLIQYRVGMRGPLGNPLTYSWCSCGRSSTCLCGKAYAFWKDGRTLGLVKSGDSVNEYK